MRSLRYLLALALTSVLIAPGMASAHPDHGTDAGSREMFPGEGVVIDDQHGGATGHLPAVSNNVTVVGKAEVTNPSGAGNEAASPTCSPTATTPT